jgi:iron(II)-dependent oxidoreductase
MSTTLDWVSIPGGICHFGDRRRPAQVAELEWTRTPISSMSVMDDTPLPLVEISFFEAVELARSIGARLPTSAEWEWMAAGAERRTFPWGDHPWDPARANLLPSGVGAPTVPGAFPAGATPEGMLDVAGNVWEWTTTEVFADGRVIRGGSYTAQPLYARCTFLNAAPQELRSKGIGVRFVREV